MEKTRWGVLSTAHIGTEIVIPAMQSGGLCEIQAIASRTPEKAERAAEKLGIPKAFGSYEELLADPEINCVYNPLPNHLHVEWSVKALEAGKHVLCEKPLAMNAQEAEQLLSTAGKFPDLKIMEAFMYRHHPQWEQIHGILDRGKIGEVHTVQSFFTYENRDPEDIRNIPEVGGGGLMDIGCYCISSFRFLFGAEPVSASAVMEIDPDFGTDRLTSGTLAFPNGTATFTCATQLDRYQRVVVLGTEGQLEVERPFTPTGDQSYHLWHHADGETAAISADSGNHYTIQGDLFARAVLEDTEVPTPLEDGVANMRVIDAVRESAESQRTVRIE